MGRESLKGGTRLYIETKEGEGESSGERERTLSVEKVCVLLKKGDERQVKAGNYATRTERERAGGDGPWGSRCSGGATSCGVGSRHCMQRVRGEVEPWQWRSVCVCHV